MCSVHSLLVMLSLLQQGRAEVHICLQWCCNACLEWVARHAGFERHVFGSKGRQFTRYAAASDATSRESRRHSRVHAVSASNTAQRNPTCHMASKSYPAAPTRLPPRTLQRAPDREKERSRRCSWPPCKYTQQPRPPLPPAQWALAKSMQQHGLRATRHAAGTDMREKTSQGDQTGRCGVWRHNPAEDGGWGGGRGSCRSPNIGRRVCPASPGSSTPDARGGLHTPHAWPAAARLQRLNRRQLLSPLITITNNNQSIDMREEPCSSPASSARCGTALCPTITPRVTPAASCLEVEGGAVGSLLGLLGIQLVLACRRGCKCGEGRQG